MNFGCECSLLCSLPTHTLQWPVLTAHIQVVGLRVCHWLRRDLFEVLSSSPHAMRCPVLTSDLVAQHAASVVLVSSHEINGSEVLC